MQTSSTALSPDTLTVGSTYEYVPCAQQACGRMPPLWPLHSFVAVNPFVGLAERSFADVCELMQRVTHEGMLMSHDYFLQAQQEGRVGQAELAEAVTLVTGESSADGVQKRVGEALAWLARPGQPQVAPVLAVSDVVASLQGREWQTLAVEEISKWCAAYYDEGQSAWRMPWRKQPLLRAWRQAALVDPTAEMLGLTGFRAYVASLPEDAEAVVETVMQQLEVPAEHAADYLHRLLMTLPGWSGYVQYRAREEGTLGQKGDALLDLLAVCLIFEGALMRALDSAALRSQWAGQWSAVPSVVCHATQMLLIWHRALELSFEKKLCAELAHATAAKSAAKPRPRLQVVFCIDVRSELMRRALESVSPEVETLGFAGFFGMPIEYVAFGKGKGVSQVPVLLKPRYRVHERLVGVSEEDEHLARQKLRVGGRLQHSWNAFKSSAVSCFSFVESAGAGFAWHLLRDTLKLRNAAGGGMSSPCGCGEPGLHAHELESIPAEDQVQLGLGALRNMGLTNGFGRLVVFCGHGSHTRNNPYAAGLDCGACGGHAGDANARVAAAILNQKAVRAELAQRGVHIPEDTFFMAGLHETTTDTVTLLDQAAVPSTHQEDVKLAEAWLESAASQTRKLRAPRLGLQDAPAEALDDLVKERSRDWSQVRPEWGLAGNAAFIAAPRERTRALDLGGRVFLHNYHAEADPERSTLELIMTAPLVVASWINLQYYASTVNNRKWGSGNKVTHNVVGTLGVMQGNGGDLRTGLPLQSVHDGQKWMHEPLRLSVFLEAPQADIDTVLRKHEHVRHLVENEWIHLFALQVGGGGVQRKLPSGEWLPVSQA